MIKGDDMSLWKKGSLSSSVNALHQRLYFKCDSQEAPFETVVERLNR